MTRRYSPTKRFNPLGYERLDDRKTWPKLVKTVVVDCWRKFIPSAQGQHVQEDQPESKLLLDAPRFNFSLENP